MEVKCLILMRFGRTTRDEWQRRLPARHGRKQQAFAPLPVLIAAIRRAQQQSDAWVRGYIPHAATWLRGERWDDEFTPLPAPDGKYSAFMRELTQQPPETIDVDSVKLG